MTDQVSALENHLVTGRFGVSGEAGVVVEEVRDFGLLQLAAWPETIMTTGAKAAQAAGVSAPPSPGRVISGEKATLLRVEPLKWWLISENSAGAVLPALPAGDGTVLNLSHSRSWIRINGRKAETLLNHFLPIDLRPGSFPHDTVASTAFHHTGVTLWRCDGGFNLMLPRSFAASLWELLQESAKQYGLEVS
jgi:heterotetrameric sarcosine oxidase gamma subunit